MTDDAQLDDALKAQASIMTYGIRSIMCAPLVVRNHCIGAVYVDSRINANLFGPKHSDLLLAFCHQAAIAIDNARLFADLNKTMRKVNEDKQYMDNIFSSIANGVITTDSAGIVTTFNDAAAKILRINPRNAVGKHFQEVFKDRPQVGISELLLNARVQHEHGTMVNNSVDCEIPGYGEVNLNLYVSALLDTQNNHIGMALVIDDRTELKRSEAKAKQIRRIFERYVHPNVVQQLIRDPKALNLGGETKEISVVFADIRGYTRLSETMPPEQMMTLLNTYLEIMVKEIWDEEGTLTAFIGDALMAIFNAPLLQEDHALRAVRATWNMRQAVQKYQQEHPQGIPIAFGFGVNTGLGVVGNLGSQGRLQNYTAIGDAVNIASRLQNNATDNNILLNHSTFIQVRQHVKVSKLAPLQVKNKSVPLDVWSLCGHCIVSIRPERVTDYPEIGALQARAFGNRPGEALIVTLLRQRRAFDPELSLVAESNGRVVGHALFSPHKMRLLDQTVPTVNLAPIAVEPASQGQGIGGQLITEGHRVAAAKGYRVSVLLGHPTYYPRFGYQTHAFGTAQLVLSSDAFHEDVLQVRSPTNEDIPSALRLVEARGGKSGYGI